MDAQGAFRNDVQLGHFDDPQLNLGLVNSYLFSSALPSGSSLAQTTGVSPVGVLEALVQSFVSTLKADKNRFSVIATYGHGKSHLALALANYFSHGAQSAEVTTLLNKLGNALGDPAKMARYRDFKKSHGEFLVVRLRGDVSNNLHDQFLLGLEKAMGEHEATRHAKLPFWFVEVERILEGWNTADQEKATRFLDTHSLDLPVLRQRLAAREDVHDLCVHLIHHVSNIRPNLGGGASLGQAVRWVTDQFCGIGKPLGGLLILFDEFSLYVQKYAQRNAAGELQDLLNGVSDREGTATFLAFSQTNVMEMADSLYLTGHYSQQGLKRELTRINHTMTLFSIMESVIGAYLKQNTAVWANFLRGARNSGPFVRASGIAWDSFKKKRYEELLRWTYDQFHEQVAKGCFPLHPITTYLLCNLELQANDATTTRTVLGFVREEVMGKADEPAAQDNQPNWVLPIRLVGYFGRRLSGPVYTQYEAAQRLIGSDAPAYEHALLQALLLQTLANITLRREGQIDFLATAAGVEEKTAKAVLRTLSDNSALRYDPTYHTYTFWSALNQPEQLKESIHKKLESFKWSMAEQEQFNQTVKMVLGASFGSKAIEVNWGHSADWAAKEAIITPPLLADWLKNQQLAYRYAYRGLEDAPRSLLVWILPTQDGEIATLRETVTETFRTALAAYGAHAPVVVGILPQQSHGHLLEAYRQYWALENLGQTEREKVGKEMYTAELNKAKLNLLKAAQELQGHAHAQKNRHAFVVPDVYVDVLRRKEAWEVTALFKELYQRAFAYAPPEFFQQYPLISRGRNALKIATQTAAGYLLQNAANALQTVAQEKSTKPLDDLCTMLIRKWELLRPNYTVRDEPGSRAIRETWQYIDQQFAPDKGEVVLRNVLIPLLNPPYGYDYNTALLLFAAWFGHHRLDITVYFGGQLVGQEALLKVVQNGAVEFFKEMVVKSVSLQQRVMQDKGEVQKHIRQAQQGSYTLDDVATEIIWLKEKAADARYDPDLQTSAQQAADLLANAKEVAEAYAAEVAKIKEEIGRARTAQALITTQNKIGKLPQLGNVQPTAETPEQLQQLINEQFQEVVEAICVRYETPTELTDVGLSRQELKKERQAIEKIGLPALLNRLEQSFERLAKHEQALYQVQQEAQTNAQWQAQIERVDINGRLVQLQQGVEELRQLNSLPEEIARQRDSHLQRVEQEIASLYHKMADTQSGLQSVTSRAALRTHRDTLVKLQPRCEGSELAEPIATQLQQADKLLSFFDQLEREQKPQLNSLEENKTQYRRLQQLRETYQADLSPSQQQLIAKVQEEIDQAVKEQRRKALAWLEQQQAGQQGQNLIQLQKTLASPPTSWAFLHENEQEPLAALRQEVRRKIDADTLQAIESRFRQIQERTVREQCVQRLQQILAEESAS
ncbi:MAG: hypothetical protein OT477_16220 [Chloroflexi bacterium]|nr:hypothetical protein [Chloroflexota bacterium]